MKEVEFSGKKHPKRKQDKKCQDKGRYGNAVTGWVARNIEHLSEISSAKVAKRIFEIQQAMRIFVALNRD